MALHRADLVDLWGRATARASTCSRRRQTGEAEIVIRARQEGAEKAKPAPREAMLIESVLRREVAPVRCFSVRKA